MSRYASESPAFSSSSEFSTFMRVLSASQKCVHIVHSQCEVQAKKCGIHCTCKRATLCVQSKHTSYTFTRLPSPAFGELGLLKVSNFLRFSGGGLAELGTALVGWSADKGVAGLVGLLTGPGTVVFGGVIGLTACDTTSAGAWIFIWAGGRGAGAGGGGCRGGCGCSGGWWQWWLLCLQLRWLWGKGWWWGRGGGAGAGAVPALHGGPPPETPSAPQSYPHRCRSRGRHLSAAGTRSCMAEFALPPALAHCTAAPSPAHPW